MTLLFVEFKLKTLINITVILRQLRNFISSNEEINNIYIYIYISIHAYIYTATRIYIGL